MCIGQIRINPSEFFTMQLGEVFTAIIGFGKVQEAEWLRTERITKEIWLSARWQTAAIMTSLGGKVVEPKSLLTFDWEDENEPIKIEIMNSERLDECAGAWGVDLSKYNLDVGR